MGTLIFFKIPSLFVFESVHIVRSIQTKWMQKYLLLLK